MTKQDLLLQTFKSKFDLSQYKKFTVEFFNDAKLLNGEKRNDYWNWNEYSFYINGYFHVADYLDDKRNKIAIFAVELKKGKSLEKARSKQRNFIADRIKVMGYDGAIAAFYSEDEKENRWRLSFVRLDYELLKGKIKTNFTPAKRYSYLLGVDEPCHTAMQQLYPILEEEKFNPSIDKLEEAFSVEKVTKQFFEKYKEKYIELYEYLSGNETFVDEAIRCVRSDRKEDISKFTEQFAKKLMGQIVFMYFLQKKGWLGVNAFPPKISEREYKNSFFNCNNEHKEIMKKLYLLDSDGNYVRQGGAISALSEEQQTYFASRIKGMPWETGPKNFVRILFKEADKYKRNYFEYYLEPLFYEALNEKRGADNYYARLHCRIPFLNGGLFEPLDGYDWKNNNFSIPNEIFSNASIKGDRESDGILDIFDRYNFTMNEDEPLEKEVAVDPEMLGKIFENLLDVKDRKSKGAFYTPREIVHYMCQESLINYIVNTVGTPYEDTKDFILYGEIMKDEDCSREVKQGIADMLMPESIYKNLKLIDDALADVRVADPAVGSGAFPMGMVNEIVKARENITAYFARELTSNAQKHQLWNYTRHPYMLKKDAMKNSIFAVDIEPSAVDITKLRLWLSLVVEFDINSDNDEFKNPPTLPNLECNILCGNSLIDEFEGVKLFNDSLLTGASSNSNWMADLFQNQVDSTLTKLIDKQKELFYANNHDDKYRLKREIDVLQQQVIFASCTMTDDIKERFISTFAMPSKPYILWKLAFAKVFKDKGGFDIVIGNPPYLEARNENFPDWEKELLQKLLRERYGKKFDLIPRGSDLLIYFFELSLRLIKKTGINSFITQNSWLDTEYGSQFQKYLLKTTNVLAVLDSDYKAFETANINTVITFFEGNQGCKKDIVFARSHKWFGEYYFPTQNNEKENPEFVTFKKFARNDDLINSNKWGFLFNSDIEFIKLISTLNTKGKKVEQLPWLKIGQGLNITKDHAYNTPDKLTSVDVEYIPYLNVDECGYYVWDTSNTFLFVNTKMSLEQEQAYKNQGYKIFDEKGCKRKRPALILPRGIGAKHFCSINKNNGYSASCVDIYIEKEENVRNLWLFMNSTLFWLLREISGRKSLGGGMLKAEAVDLKQFPLYFDFNENEKIDALINESIGRKVLNAVEEINTEFHQKIDALLYSLLDISDDIQLYIHDMFVRKFNERTKKSTT
ncbi:MAG: N-6 DNA methylase [Clostridia bacterium]|nr:N-6 DNA methylase [Clostridia bacterium]